MSIAVLYSNTNVKGKNDAGGAFIPEAQEFARVHNIPDRRVIGIRLPGVSKAKRRERTYDAIEKAAGDHLLEGIALFGHGWPQGIQFGFNREHIPELVEVINDHCYTFAKVTLFACLAAENDERDRNVSDLGPGTDNGFADLLRDEMVRGVLDRGWVDAHKTAGHTTWNPFLVRFYCTDVDDPEFGAVGGSWIIQPRSELWRKWIKALKNKKRGLRYRFPYMTESEIRKELDQ